MSRPVKHHFVPRFYLKEWVPPSRKQLWVLDKTNGDVFQASPKRIAHQEDFYTIPKGNTEIEKWLSELERNVAPVLESINIESSVEYLLPKERRWLDALLAIQWERTEVARQRQEDYLSAIEYLIEELEEQGIDTSEVRSEILEAKAKKNHLSSLTDIHQFVDSFGKLDMGLRVNEESLPLTTCDNPVFRINQFESPPISWPEGVHPSRLVALVDRHPVRDEWVTNLGVESRGIEIYLPISPEHAVVALDGSVWGGGSFPVRGTWDGIDGVETFRELVLGSARRFVYSSTSDFDLELDLLEERPGWTDPNRPRKGVLYNGRDLVAESMREEHEPDRE